LLTSTYGKGVRKPFVLNVLSFVLALLAAGFFPENARLFFAIQV
jgi:hypothetical protein